MHARMYAHARMHTHTSAAAEVRAHISITPSHHSWMLGRFVMDRNGVVWHKQANRASKRYGKAHGTLTKLKRWKALHNTMVGGCGGG